MRVRPVVPARGRTLIALLLLLLGSVVTALAEDAWVLWVRKDYDAGLASEWRIVAQFRTRTECIEMMKVKRRESGESEPMRSADDERGYSFSVAAGGGAGTALQCVNDISDRKAREGRSDAATLDETGWILWIKHDYDAALEGEWTVMRQRATREQCISELREEFGDAMDKFRSYGLTKAAQTMEQSAARGSILVVGRGHAITAKCLPDTADPRRPKAK